MFFHLFALNAYAALAVAATIDIQVSSSSNALTYSPNSVTANQGDMVVFSWQAADHTVVQGQGVSAPCQPQVNGFYSGFQGPATTFTIEVNNTEPIWFYCARPTDCQLGMVGVINPPQGVSIQDYAKAASSASSNPAPNVPDGLGGTLNTSPSSTGSTSPTSTSSSGSGSNPYGYGGGSSTPSSNTANGYDIPVACGLLVAGALVAYM